MQSSPDKADRGRPSLSVAPMVEDDLDEVLAIEKVSYPTPWTRESFLFELRDNPFAWNVVARLEGRLVGYASAWRMDRQLRINNIAIRPEARGRGLGRELLGWLLREAAAWGCREASLEVRPSNRIARSLYESFGFREISRRRGYYQDNHEDAIVMAVELPGASRG